MVTAHIRLGFAIVLAFWLAIPVTATRQSGFPPTLDRYLTNDVRLSAAERQTLLSGAPVSKLLDADASKEVAVFGTIWIATPAETYVERVKDIERFERGGAFRATRKLSTPPRLDDFNDLHLVDDDFEDLRTCRVGDCEVKLSASALEMLRSQVDWKKATARADAEAVLRRVALDYVTTYRSGGNAALAVYRDKDQPTFVSQEFESMVARLPALSTYVPELRNYLLNYPRVTITNATDFLYWQEADFGLKPTVRINHLIIEPRPDGIVIASKMLYASHYFWTALELRVLVLDATRGRGFWFITVNRSRSDGLSGFTGMLVRNRAKSEAQKGTLAVLASTKSAFEGPR